MNTHTQLWQLMEGQDTHTDFLTFEEASEMEGEYMKDFPDNNYWIQPTFSTPKEGDTYKNTPRGAADGWEDLHY